jgi:hypothetical protein
MNILEKFFLGALCLYGLKKMSEPSAAVGRVATKMVKTKFIDVYKEVPIRGIFKGKTNIGFTQGKIGVYIIAENNNQNIVYVGKSNSNLYKTILRHFSEWLEVVADRRDPPHKQQSKHPVGYKFNYEERFSYVKWLGKRHYTVRVVLCKTPEQVSKLEKALIIKHQPRDNANKYDAYWQQEQAEVQRMLQYYADATITEPEDAEYWKFRKSEEDDDDIPF